MRTRVESRVPQVTARMRAFVTAAVQETIVGIEAGAKMRAPVDTGFLRSSIRSTITGPMEGRVDVQAEYAEPVEFGHVTRSGSHVAARPFLMPAVAAQRARFRAAVAAAVAKAGT